uniref:Ipt tig domain containing protein n=1 Tax=Tetraselmis sp. GSL018 TaxID=582737 RepID=A0A061S937_9CHLO
MWPSGYAYNLTYRNITFVNFDRSDMFAWSNCAHCNFPETKNNGAKTNYMRKITYVNSDSRVYWSTPRKGVWQDEDGTGLGGAAGQYAVAKDQTAFLEGVCSDAGVEWGSSKTWFCPSGMRVARLAVYGMKPFSPFYLDALKITRIVDTSQRCRLGNCSCGSNSSEPSCIFSAYDTVDYRGYDWEEPKNGWAVPLTSGHRYKLSWPEDPDFTEMTVEVSYLMPGDHLYLEFSYMTTPDHFGVFLNGLRIGDPSNATWPLASKESGAAYMNVKDRTLTLLMSGTNHKYPAITDNVRVVRFECPEVDGVEVCPVPERPQPGETEDSVRRWSNASMWQELGHDGVPSFPNSKDNTVKIPVEWTVLMDRSFVEVLNLEVYGRLIFDESLSSTTLRVHTLQIWGGEVVAGNETHPFASELRIEFWGFPWSTPVQLGSWIDAGTNVLAVLGRLELYGQERSVRWTRLRETSAAGSVWLYPENYGSLDWAVGDELVVSSTTADQFEAEKVRIAAMSDTDERVLISGQFQHKHFGSAAAEKVNEKALDVRAEVGLISNSIEIAGDASIVNKYGFGCHVLVTSYDVYVGNAILHNVRIANCGQRNTNRFALNFLEPSAINISSIFGCTITDSLTSGLSIRGTSGLNVSGSVIFNSTGSNVEIVDSSSVSFQGNLALLVDRISSQPGREVYEGLCNFNLCKWDRKRNRRIQSLIVHNCCCDGGEHNLL